MLERNGGTIRAVAWSEICPWLSIFRTFRLAISFRALLLGAVAILLTVIGWGLLGWFFSIAGSESASTAWLKPFVASYESSWKEIAEIVPDIPVIPELGWQLNVALPETSYLEPSDPIFFPFMFLNRPLLEGLLGMDVNLKSLVCLISCGFWSLAVWSFFGSAICRLASVQLATDERLGWDSVLRHSGTKYFAYLSAPLIPLAGMALAAIPVAVVGLIMHIGAGIFLAALVWPLLLVAGLIMTILFLGLLFGWPLMWGTISTEGTDSFDALSRSYAYVFQRPLHYLFYAFVAAIFGWLGWLLVRNFAAGIVWMTYWAASWGATDAQIQAVMPGGTISGMGYAGAKLIHFWTDCVKLLAVGYLFSYFWTASVAIYFLLRRTVDATEMDEVFLDADESEKSFGLPKIVTGDSGAPMVSESSPAVNPDAKPQSDKPSGTSPLSE
jgi:hypothetical protein